MKDKMKEAKDLHRAASDHDIRDAERLQFALKALCLYEAELSRARAAMRQADRDCECGRRTSTVGSDYAVERVGTFDDFARAAEHERRLAVIAQAGIDSATAAGSSVIVRPGDTLIVAVPGPVTSQEIHDMTARLRLEVPGAGVAVVAGAMQLAVYRPGGAGEVE